VAGGTGIAAAIAAGSEKRQNQNNPGTQNDFFHKTPLCNPRFIMAGDYTGQSPKGLKPE